ncbi:carcinoembryonic antigen-related cell adhesion molecule 20 isoform X2 [Micropterus salmoides]|uniref:carcinoembryonic antigen-related cell adhesion molecule 20 isoform X2 n=1 Tax=Micropterus salmoides TaxID=27706 RepID=UPI0018EBFA84|nr:carcinoembryonic antigen-related cell adhesion molecule 20 isoform X2 [Micropterus salmoides]
MDLFAVKSPLFLLAFIGCCAGQSVLPSGPVDAIVGRNVTLTTLVDKANYDYITWNFNNGAQFNVATLSRSGLKVGTRFQGRASINATNGYLTLTSLTAADGGDYSISILSPEGTQTGDLLLRVLEAVSNVAITSSLPEAIELNSTVVLNCSAKGSFLKFTWTNGTAPIVADGTRLTVKEGDLSSALTIAGVLRTDLLGPIYCTASNSLEKATSAPFNLTVYYGPDQVTITPVNPPEYLKSGSNFSLSCSVLSNPPATFTWYHNEQLMEASGPVLTLDVIEKHGIGSNKEGYTCRAKNAKTQRTVSSPAVSFAVLQAISGITITGPTATLIAGNSTANLSCQATSGTVMSRKWKKNGSPLSPGTRIVFAADMSSVMINPLQKEDNGNYSCELENPVHKVDAAYMMVVNYGPEQVSVKGDKAVKVDNPVKLTCDAESVPAGSFTWRLNDTLTGVTTKTYAIEKAGYQNTGMYTCEVFNTVTGKTSKFTHVLTVKAEITEGLSDGAIAGIVIGVLIAVGIAIGLIFYCRQKVPSRSTGTLQVESPY